MVIVDTLVFHCPGVKDVILENRYLEQTEIIRRIKDRFPQAVIDRERADQLVRQNVEYLVTLGAPKVVVENKRAEIGKVAYVTVSSESGEPRFGFFMYSTPWTMDVDYEPSVDRAGCRQLLEAVAATIGYDIEMRTYEE